MSDTSELTLVGQAEQNGDLFLLFDGELGQHVLHQRTDDAEQWAVFTETSVGSITAREIYEAATPYLARASSIAEDDYVAWCTYQHHEDGTTTISTCDSDAKGAFKVYRASGITGKDTQAPNCEHGVSQSMECLNCTEEYVASPPIAEVDEATPQMDQRQIENALRRFGNGTMLHYVNGGWDILAQKRKDAPVSIPIPNSHRMLAVGKTIEEAITSAHKREKELEYHAKQENK